MVLTPTITLLLVTNLTITTGDGTITGNGSDGIGATNSATGTDLTITTGVGDVSGYDNGIEADNFGSGALSITTGVGAITGNGSNGIGANNSSNGTDLTITTGGGDVTGYGERY